MTQPQLTAVLPPVSKGPATAAAAERLAALRRDWNLAASQPGDEVRRLLRRRLCLMALLLLLAFLYYTARNLLGSGDPAAARFSVLIQFGFLAVTGLLALAVCTRPWMGLARLRLLELLLVGAAALHLAWLDGQTLFDAAVLLWMSPPLGGVVLRLALGTAAVRWFLLLVGYGILIPNSVRRCAVVLVFLTLMPLLIAGGAGLIVEPLRGCLWQSLPQMAAVLLAGAAMAVFACAGINRLPSAVLESDVLGPYRLKECRRGGGMGTVYLAEHVLLGRRCAVKLLRPEQARDPDNRLRFEYEARVMASLAHPNAVEVYDAGRSGDGTCYYVMEYLDGATLEEIVARDGPLSPRRAVGLLRQLCDVLGHAHAHGLLHLDIKPSNVVVVTRGAAEVVKLLDFGLARHAAGLEAPLADCPLGSPAYMSPEQAGGGALDPRSDVYSVGGLAYFLLTGRPPFVGESALQLLLAHACDAVTPLSEPCPDVPRDLEQVVMRCLEKDPARRFADASALGQALAHCAEGPERRRMELTQTAPVA